MTNEDSPPRSILRFDNRPDRVRVAVYGRYKIMGTNYYAEIDCCEHCGRPAELKHIGKSSAGWHFSLHVDGDIGSLNDWAALFSKSNCTIRDEYGVRISADQMLSIIAERSNPEKVKNFDFLANHAEPGLNNLVMSRVDGSHCVGHGEGPWDLIRGDFS